MIKSLIRKMKRQIKQPLIKVEDTLVPGEFYWINNEGDNFVNDQGDRLIFKG